MILHEIRRPNSLKTVANCCNLPFGRRATRGSLVRLPREENTWSRHRRLFEENVGKTRKVWSTNFNRERFGSCFLTHGEGISTPRVCHKGRQPSIKCANMTFKIMYFSLFYVFMSFYAFLYFFIFLWSTRVFPSLLRILQLR